MTLSTDRGALQSGVNFARRLTVKAAVEDAASGHNVYVEARTVAGTAAGRGRAADTVGVFAFVIDCDADKGKAGKVAVEPSLVVETSPGNRHLWFFLDRALTSEEAEPIGAAIRAATGADSDTGVVTQPYRVAGTPNFPSARKRARGRYVTATFIVEHSGGLWTTQALLEAFPAPVAEEPIMLPRRAGHAGSGPPASAVIAEVAELGLDHPEGRSGQFQLAVCAAVAAGLSPDELEQLMRAYPSGCASKYLDRRDRLRAELERSWRKALAWRGAARLVVDPTYPDRAKPVFEARAAVERAIRAHLEAAERYGC